MQVTKTAIGLTATMVLAIGLPGCDDDGGASGPDAAGFCSRGGITYAAGATFPDVDGCNSCTCERDGRIFCTLMFCSKDGGMPTADAPADRSGPVTCSYGGKTYQAGDSFKDQQGCNTCWCGSAGSVECTAMACLGDAAPPPPDAPKPLDLAPDSGSSPYDSSPRDAAPAEVAPSSCTLPATITFGPDGGMVIYRDRYSLDPKTGMTITRSYTARASVDGASLRTCTPPLPACGAPGIVSLADIVADLAAADVQAAFKSGSTPFYGYDLRPVDGPALSITLGDRGSILVGRPCSSSDGTTCVAIPAGVQRLADHLQSLGSAAMATSECGGL